MTAVYFYLIIDNLWSFKNVPAAYKEDVRALLVKEGKGHLCAEE